MKPRILICSLLFLFSCSNLRTHKDATHTSLSSDLIEKLIDDKHAEKSYAIELKVNSKVQRWINYFTERSPERFQRFLNRGLRFRDVVMTTLEEHDLPGELYYLAMIESGYYAHAKSHASAVGVWQFIRGTGKQYNLKIDPYIDERRDPIRSTESAARYLRDLYQRFNSWELAAAAYNCGESRVARAIRRGGSRDFWVLAQKRLLPPETRNYVPKWIAAIIIGESPEKFGLKTPELEVGDEYPSVDAVAVPSPLRLADISEVTKIPLKEIKEVNPHLIHGLTSPRYKTYELWIPSDHKSDVENNVVALQKYVKNSKSYIARIDERTIHRVRRGENLWTIAKKYRESVGFIKRINGLRSSRIYPGQSLRISSRGYKKARRSYASSKARYYRVRRGENLSSIGKKFGVSWRSIKSWNSLRSTSLRPGQRLKIFSRSNVVSHRVRKGESLYLLAKRYKTSIRNIKRKNNLKSNRLYVGMVLNIPRG